MKKTLSYLLKQPVFFILTAVVIIVMFMKQAHAYRPLGTEDAGVGAMGEIVLEFFYEHTVITPVSGNDVKQKAGGFAFVYGLGFAELAVEGPYWIDNGADESGFGDLTFFAKILLTGKTENEGMLTLKAETTGTTGDEKKGLGEEDWVYYLSLVFTKAFEPIKVHLHGGYEYVDDGESSTNSWGYGFALDIGLSSAFSIVGEINGNYNSDANPMTYLAGLVITLNDNIALDAGYSAPVNSDAKDGADNWWNIIGGITFTF